MSLALGVFVCGFFAGLIVLTTPAPARAQEEDKPAEKVEKEEKAEKKINPLVGLFRWILGGLKGVIETMVVLLIIVISIAMVALFVFLLFDIRLGEAVPTAFVEEFTDMVNKRQFKQAYELCRNETSFLGRVLTAGMARLQYGIEDAREAMAAMTESVRASKDSWISYLGVVGTLGPLLGLVGTVVGMIGAFSELGASDKAPNPSALAADISTALVLTFLGIGISVPAVFAFSFFKNRLTNVSVAAANLADDLLTQMYHNSKKSAASSTATTERVPGKT
jgi:biopolymer transport protein ExbB